MKTPHQTQTEVNLLTPLNPDSIVPAETTDCFGTAEYSPQDKDCSICSDIEICGIKFQELTKTRKKEVETTQGPLLDQSDFEGVNMAKIEKLAAKYQNEGQRLTFAELQEVITLQAKTKDNEAVIEFIKRELPLTNMYLKEGEVHVR